MSQGSKVPVAPVQARVVVPGSADRAFEVFTEAFGEWWPLASHSVFGDKAAGCTLEARAGGRIVERHADGRESVWGEVQEASPPGKLRFSWHPGREASSAQEVTVTFEPMMFGTTVTLVHGAWENAGPAGKDMRTRYERDWPGVLNAFVERINRR